MIVTVFMKSGNAVVLPNIETINVTHDRDGHLTVLERTHNGARRGRKLLWISLDQIEAITTEKR